MNWSACVPRAVFEAHEERHIINKIQREILAQMYFWANSQTGEIDEFNAVRLCEALNWEPDVAHRRMAQRHLNTLEGQGWFHDDHINGSNQNYRVWMHNFSISRGIFGQGTLFRDNDAENDADNVADGNVLNPCKIDKYGIASRSNVAECDAENVVDGNRKGIGIGTKAFSQGGNTEPDDANHFVDAASDLFVEAQRYRGVPENRLVDMVSPGRRTNDVRRFLTSGSLPPKDRWTTLDRTINLFCLWVQRHPTRNLDDALSVFLKQWRRKLPQLEEWESTATEQFRAMPSGPEPKFQGQKFNSDDPRYKDIAQLSYTLTGILPPVKSVDLLLKEYSVEDIKGALNEFAGTLDDSEYKSGMKKFFDEGGVCVVIYARKNRITQAA